MSKEKELSLDERFQLEKDKWNNIASKKLGDNRALLTDDDFHNIAKQDEMLPGVSEFLGNLSGKRLLELGCGVGFMATLLAKSGAKVTAFDLSKVSVQVAKERSEVNASPVDCLVASGERLPFPDESFDVIFGKSILHHLDMELAQYDIQRVIKSGGKAVFIEPLGMNPLLNIARDHIPYPHKGAPGVDQPLNYEDISFWTKDFQKHTFQEFQLLSMIERAFGWGNEFQLLRKLDQFLLNKIPILRRFCRYVVIFSVK